MRSNYKKLGPYIKQFNSRNSDLEVDLLLGVSIKKILMPSIANTVGTNMRTYKIIKKGQFAYGPVTSRNGDKISVALLEEYNQAIVSQAYTVFEIINPSALLPEYLMMWFSRPEFDRYARFKSHGSARETFDWDELCEVELPIPSPQKQQEIVKEYNTIVNRIELNEELNRKLDETAQTLYEHWFVDSEFPMSKAYAESKGKPELEGKPYKSNGGEFTYNEKLGKSIPVGWHHAFLGEMCECLDGKRRPVSKEKRQLIQGEIPYYGAMSIVDYINDYLFNGTFLLMSEDGVNIVDENGRPALQYVWGKFWLNNHAHILKGKGKFSTEYLMLSLGRQNVAHLVTGAAQPKLNQKNVMSIDMINPEKDVLLEFQKLLKPIFQQKKNYREEVRRLNEISELLLGFCSMVQRKLEIIG